MIQELFILQYLFVDLLRNSVTLLYKLYQIKIKYICTIVNPSFQNFNIPIVELRACLKIPLPPPLRKGELDVPLL